LYRYRFVVVEVARQSGKTLVMLILALWHIYALDSKMVIGTAQDLTRSEKSWAEAVEWAMDNDELAPLIEDVKRGHPKVLTLITAVSTGWRQHRGGVAAVYRRPDPAGRVARAPSWDSWASVTNTMNARPGAGVGVL
jgi:hypothetical protein